MSTQNPTPDYAGLSKQEVAERLKNPTPDATATPRDCAPKNFMTPEQCAQQFEMYAQSNPSTDSQHSLRFCAKFLREFCKQEVEHELAAVKAERDQLRARVAELEKERTEWSLIYRRDYGHDWSTRGNYKGF